MSNAVKDNPHAATPPHLRPPRPLGRWFKILVSTTSPFFTPGEVVNEVELPEDSIDRLLTIGGMVPWEGEPPKKEIRRHQPNQGGNCPTCGKPWLMNGCRSQ